MKRLRHIFLIITGLFFCTGISLAQHKVGTELEFDKLVHNFGDIVHKSGPVSCTFTVKNTGSKPAVIYNVVSTCGCTDVKWTKEPLRPGQTGKVSVTYTNDQGAYPFDKTLTTYTSDSKKPILLKVRGVSTEGRKPLKETYPVAFGPLGLRENDIKCGNLEQGMQKSEAVMVANLSSKPVKVAFTGVSDFLKISVSPNPIPANSTAEMSFTVTADRSLWGKNYYYATPVIDGKTYKNASGDSRLKIWAFTKEDFPKLDQDQKAKGPRPTFRESTYTFGKVKKGAVVEATFTFTNDGKETFRVFKADSDAGKWSCGNIAETAPGGKTSFKVTVDTSDMPKGESMTIVTLTTNSPLRPIVNLFIAGYIE